MTRHRVSQRSTGPLLGGLPALLAVCLALCAVSVVSAGRALASEREIIAAVEARLTETQLKRYRGYRKSYAAHQARLARYWSKVRTKRRLRRKKRKAGKIATPADYVLKFPPQYKGLKLPASITKIIAQEREKRAKVSPPRKSSIPSVREAVADAKTIYKFVPKRVSERRFKELYAREALRHDLNKDQVVRIYTFETGGNGTYDMQAGIHPISKKGSPISTALGYAQLLAANSISELVKHGRSFVKRLKAMARRSGVTPERRAELNAKANALTAMWRTARSVPNDWYKHISLSRTRKGFAIHAINLDADIGPWLQAKKLKGIKELAQKWGLRKLTAAELELMNLAGPRTGYEMLQPLAWDVPTTNFFSRRAYYRNSVTRGRTARELRLEIEKRMTSWIKSKGSQEFIAAFDAVMRRNR